MKKYPLYALPIKYMMLFSLALLFSGLWLFLLSQDFSIKYIEKSLHHSIEVATPHLFAMGILIFIVAHFLLFSTVVKNKYALIASQSLYLFMFLNIFSSLFMSLGYAQLIWIKLIALSGFLFLFLLVLGMLYLSI